LKVSFQNITSGECVFAENTHIGAVTGVSQKVAFKMLRVKIGLGTVRARKLAVGILGRNRGASSGSVGTIGDCSASWNTGKNTSSSLRSHNLSTRRLAVVRKRSLTISGCSHWICASPDRSSAFWVTEGA
jgi:hypothetical protein